MCSATPPFPACILLILQQNILATVEDQSKGLHYTELFGDFTFGRHPGWRLVGEGQSQLFQEDLELRLRLGIPGHDHFAAVGCRKMDIYHLNSAELFQHGARG